MSCEYNFYNYELVVLILHFASNCISTPLFCTVYIKIFKKKIILKRLTQWPHWSAFLTNLRSLHFVLNSCKEFFFRFVCIMFHNYITNYTTTIYDSFKKHPYLKIGAKNISAIFFILGSSDLGALHIKLNRDD